MTEGEHARMLLCMCLALVAVERRERSVLQQEEASEVPSLLRSV